LAKISDKHRGCYSSGRAGEQEVNWRPAFVKSALLKSSYRPPARPFDLATIETVDSGTGCQHLVCVVTNVGGEMQGAAEPQSVDEDVDDVGTNQSTIVMSLFWPRVRKVHAHGIE
jgi:hypothetical protein